MGSNNNYVTSGAADGEVQNSNGEYRVVGGYLVRNDGETYLKLSDYEIYREENDIFYLLPNGLMLRASMQGESLEFQSVGGGAESVSYSFNDVIIELTEDKKISAITYMSGGEISRKIDFTAETVTMNVGSAGGSIYLIRDDDALMWELPDGSHIYMKSAFIKTGVNPSEVEPIFLKDKFYLLEKITNGRTEYHVVELEKNEDDIFIFKAGYIYKLQEALNKEAEDETQSANDAKAKAKAALNAYEVPDDAIGDDGKITVSAAILTEISEAVRKVLLNTWNVSVSAEAFVTGEPPAENYTVTVTVTLSTDDEQVENIDLTREFNKAVTEDPALPATEPEAGDIKPETYASFGLGTFRPASRVGKVVIETDPDTNEVSKLSIKYDSYPRYLFDTEIDESGYYRAVRDVSNTSYSYNSCYDDIKDAFFTASYDAETQKYTVKAYQLKAKAGAEGAISGGNFNGGYKKVDAGYLFVDNIEDTEGILYIEDKVVAFSPDGKFYVVSVDYARDDDGSIIDDLTKATMMYGPQMEHAKDSTGSEMYSKFYMKYRDPEKANNPEEQQWTEFITDGFDEAYQNVLAELQEADKQYNLVNGYDANGDGIEDENETWMHRYVGSLRQAENLTAA